MLLELNDWWLLVRLGLLCDGDIELGSQRIELSQFDIELAFPEFARIAFDERLAKRVDAFASRMPSGLAGCDSDSVVDEPRTNDALDLVDTVVKSFSILDQGTKLTMCFRGHVNGFKLVHGRHSSQFQCIVFVGFAFHVGPGPSIFVGRAGERLEFKTLCKIVDPTRWAASFHDDEFGRIFLEDFREIITIGSGVNELMFASF